MNRHVLLIISILGVMITGSLYPLPLQAQAPQAFTYQAFVRDADGNPLVNQPVSIQITLHQGSEVGYEVYSEIHSVTTNPLGLVNLEIGQGTVVFGVFSGIAWETAAYYLEVELDPAGGTAYVPMGTIRLVSVPYALYSEKTGEIYSAGTGIDIIDHTIHNIAPDQEVLITGDIGINVSGAYPDFTITNTLPGQPVNIYSGYGIEVTGINPDFTISNSSPDQMIYLNPGNGILISGTYPDFTIINTAPNANHSGDASGNDVLAVVGIQGRPVSAIVPIADQVLQWNGSQWIPSTISSGSLGWSLIGNSGTNPAINFLGTVDNQPLCFRVNNQLAGKIDPVNNNTFLGPQSGINMAGYNNTAIGAQVLASNTTGNTNTASGYKALYSNTTGTSNIAIGPGALYNNTNRNRIVAIGDSALYKNGLGATLSDHATNNTAVGSKVLYYNTTGYHNTAIGYRALMNNSNGYLNTASGHVALVSNTTGNYNTANGNGALFYNSSGSFNTAIGASTMFTNETGSGNTALGYSADVGSNNLSNAMVMGNLASVNASNKVRIGNASVTVIEGQVDWSFPSDGRFKQNVSEEVQGLAFIRQLRPVVYNFDTRKYTEFLMKNMPDNLRNERLNGQDFTASTAIRHSGFVAQEVIKAAAACGYDFDGVHVPVDDNDNYSIAYGQFVIPLVKAVQEQQAMINEQQSMVNTQQELIEDLQKKVAALEAELGRGR